VGHPTAVDRQAAAIAKLTLADAGEHEEPVEKVHGSRLTLRSSGSPLSSHSRQIHSASSAGAS